MFGKRSDKKTNKRNGSGASRSGSADRKKSVINIQAFFSYFNVRYMLIFSAVVLSGSGIYASFIAVDTVMDVAVENVKIKGILVYQSQQDVSDIINNFTDKGFVNVNLQELHDDLLALPWVASVRIKRELPNGLLIELSEQKAIAQWNDHALINEYGDVFNPEENVKIEGLIRFYGEEHTEILALYQQVKKMLPADQQPIQSLQMNAMQVVDVVLANGAQLVLKLDALPEQLNRWNIIVDKAETLRMKRIKKVDLRYDSGAAVSWKNEPKARNEMQLGSR